MVGGGGIFNFGSLNLKNSRVTSSTSTGGGGGIYNNIAATLNVSDSSIGFNTSIGDGGGIYNMSIADVIYSRLDFNGSEGSGGGIYNKFEMTFSQGAILENAAISGAGIYVEENGTADVINATVASNAATFEGGGFFNAGTLNVTNATVTLNEAFRGGGVMDGQVFDTNFWNSIIHGNTISEGGQASPNCFGSIDDKANNIVGDTTGCFFGGSFAEPVSDDPQLEDLAINGGSTPTYALASGSPAIDAANTKSASAIDQRGQARPVDAPDIGAFELSTGKVIKVATESDVQLSAGCDGDCTLREAIAIAEPGDTVLIPSGTYTVDATLPIFKDLALTGYGVNETIIQAASKSGIADHRVLDTGAGLDSGETIYISHLTVRHGNVEGNAGGIGNFADLVLRRTTIRNNTASPDGDGFSAGGGIFTFNGSSLKVIESTIRDNDVNARSDSLGASGGGIMAFLSDVTIERSTIHDNFAAWHGGGISTEGTAVSITNSTFSDNRSARDGGAIRTHNSSPVAKTVIVHATIVDNEAGGEGGGIYAAGSVPAEVSNSIVAGNFADTGNNCAGAPISRGYNILSIASGCSLADDPTTLAGVDLALEFLWDWGGTTWTHKLGEGSFAIDGAFAPSPSFDQRGVSRTWGDAADVGAFESTEFHGTRPPLPEPTPTPTPTPRPTPTPTPRPTATPAPTPTPVLTPTPTLTPTAAPALPGPLLSAGARVVHPGGEVRVPVLLADAADLAEIDFTLAYDDSVIVLADVVAGSLLEAADLNLDATVSGLIVFEYDAPGGSADAGSLVYIVFSATEDVDRVSPLDLEISGSTPPTDLANRILEPLVVDGEIRVEEKTVEGDYDGDEQLTELDAVVALQMALGLLDEDLFLDVDGDGAVTIDDALALLQNAVQGG